MTRYRVFYGAPAAKDIGKHPSEYQWRTTTTTPRSTEAPAHTLPPATLAAASRRISMMYENVIFGVSQEGDGALEPPLEDTSAGNEDTHAGGQTTVITWPLTTQATNDQSRTRGDVTFFRSQRETQESQETESYEYSNASSIAQFPAFHFSLHALTSLATLTSQAQAARAHHVSKASHKITVLAAVLEVDGPDSIRVKKGSDAGKEVSLLKLILGDESGGICKLAAWRDTADAWGGLIPEAPTPSVKKGDIVLLENVLASWEAEPTGSTTATIPINLSASPQLKSRLEICYRTLPSAPQDARLRPDLRLGLSDAAVRRVASVVKWFEAVAGLSPS